MSAPAFHPELDPAAARTALARDGLVQIADFLAEASAAALANELEALQAWDLTVTTDHGPTAFTAAELQQMNPARRGQLMESIRRQARAGFSFAYYRRNVLPGDDPVAAGFADWIQSPTFLEAMRELTGDDTLTRADAHASLYREGSFLRGHDDTYAGRNRRYAYVLNLSREWQADWGGLLHFEDQGAISACLVPRFNTFNLFRVPRMHFVSQVASYARARRLTITGWLFAE